MSPACEKIFGYHPLTFGLNPDTYFEIITDDDREMVKESVCQLKPGHSALLEHKIKNRMVPSDG